MTHSIYIKADRYYKRKITYVTNTHYIKFDIQERHNEEWVTVIDGSIKWDGCSSLNYQGNIHYCGFVDAQHWLDIIRCCYCICEEEMPNWDGLGEEYTWPKGYAKHDT